MLGPAGLALVGATMAGMIGGAIGGAIAGGLDGGWKGALIGGAIGGALGGLGGWAVGGGSTIAHPFVLAGMFAGGVGNAAATGSWDSFAGGLVGAIGGAIAGQGIVNAYSQQFANYRAGNGFISNATLRAKMANGNFQSALDEAVANGDRRVNIDERFVDKTDLIYRLRGGGEGGPQSAASRGFKFLDPLQADYNVSVGRVVGITGGIKTDSSGVYGYAGGGLGLELGGSMTNNPGPVTTGWSGNVSGSLIVGVGVKGSLTYNANGFSASVTRGVGFDVGVSGDVEYTGQISSSEN